MKKILKSVYAPFLLIPIAMVYFFLMHCAIRMDMNHSRKVEFEKCIEAYPSDAVCDSCYTAIYQNQK